MRVDTRNLVSYAVQFVEESSCVKQQQQAVQAFLVQKNKDTLINISPYRSYPSTRYTLQNEYVEEITKKSKKFAALERALIECKRTGASLVIASKQIKQLIKNTTFTQLLTRYRVPFNCIEQPNLSLETLPAILDFLEAMSRGHSEIIRKALESARGPLGNPNALKEITKVNKPKRENAVMFALMLAPIIHEYRKQGLSQRKIVDALNTAQYLAPEGGLWVLSQLQKVLERIELNAIALDRDNDLQEFDTKNYTDAQRVKALNAMGAKAPGRGQWDEKSLKSVSERIEMIDDIIDFNQFILECYPEIHEAQEAGQTFTEIADTLNQKHVTIPSRIRWELAHQSDEEHSDAVPAAWNDDAVQIAIKATERRLQDVQHYMHESTLKTSLDILDEVKSA